MISMYGFPLYENEFSFPLTEFNVVINFPSVVFLYNVKMVKPTEFLYNVKMVKPTETCNKY